MFTTEGVMGDAEELTVLSKHQVLQLGHALTQRRRDRMCA